MRRFKIIIKYKKLIIENGFYFNIFVGKGCGLYLFIFIYVLLLIKKLLFLVNLIFLVKIFFYKMSIF